MLIGILLGFSAATAQSVSYLLSRAYVRLPGHSPMLLLVISQVIMGGFSLVLLPLVKPPGDVWQPQVLWTAAGVGGFYLVGQVALFRTLRTVDASKIVPMLGLKILFLALVGVLLLDQPMPVRGWLAVLLAIGGVFLVNESGGRLPWRGGVGVLLAVTGYSLSDLSIVRLTGLLDAGGWRGIAFGAALSYLMCGVVLATLLPAFPAARRARAWRGALPYSLCWFTAMLLLFGCFARIGAVFGNIVQSSRGLLSIGLGICVARAGFTGIEQRLSAQSISRRLAGALAISAAIALYVLGG